MKAEKKEINSVSVTTVQRFSSFLRIVVSMYLSGVKISVTYLFCGQKHVTAEQKLLVQQ